MSVIRLDGLAKSFKTPDGKGVSVLQSVSFEMAGPTVLGILGPNGVGKSVTMRLLAGLDEPDGGSITIDDRAPKTCQVGYVPAGNPVFGWRRVVDDISMRLELMGIPRAKRHAQVAALLRRFSIDLPLDRRTYALSSGQRQMVNLARAMVGPEPPPVLALDEPWTALSPTVREEFLRYLEMIRASMDVVVVLSSHHLDSAILACDWILPFRERPVCLTQDDLIRVNFPRPRPADVRQLAEFQDLLKRLEEVFRNAIPLTL